MRYKDIIQLVNVVNEVDEYGRNIEKEEISGYIYANKYTVGHEARKVFKETYNASVQSLRNSISFEIHFSEYNDESYLKYNNKIFTILSVIEKGETIILMGVERIGKR